MPPQFVVAAVANPVEKTPSPPSQLQKDPKCRLVFVDESGNQIPVMAADYGFRSGAGRLYQSDYGTVPRSVWALALANFSRELEGLRRGVRYDEVKTVASSKKQNIVTKTSLAVNEVLRKQLLKVDSWLEEKGVLKSLDDSSAQMVPFDARDPSLSEEQRDVLQKVKLLKLDDKKVSAREMRRHKEGRDVDASLFVRIPYSTLCWVLDAIYEGRPIQRFWFLENVARMPYFAFLSLLHLYESLGWWRAAAELRKVHFAEEWNELHHLQIMESLGGDTLWIDRFLSQHAAIFYYWVLVAMYLISPPSSYAFCELVENHATDTYTEFFEQNETALKAIPPPLVALNYYKGGDLYIFDAFQSSNGYSAALNESEARRPPCNNLYDVFVNIRDDEIEHAKTMSACQDNSIAIDLQNAAGMLNIAEEQGIKSLVCSVADSDDE